MSTTKILKTVLMLGAIATLVACGGGGSSGGSVPQSPNAHQVTLSWTANREADVNTVGGGYQVAISGHSVIDVPYPSAPSITLSLTSGQYNVTVTAYSSTNPATGLTAVAISNYSRPSAAWHSSVTHNLLRNI